MVAKTFRQLTGVQPRRVNTLKVMKSDDDRHLVFRWANVVVGVDGEQIVDYQEDAIDPEDLEMAEYAYVADFGTFEEMH